MLRRFLLACIQLNSKDDLRANLERCRYWIRRAAERDAELILLPEDFAFLARSEKDKKNLTNKELDSILDTIREEAIRFGVYIVAGGHPVRTDDGEKFFNTSTLLSPTGDVLGQYQKIHLFDADPPGAVPLRESDMMAAGNTPVVVKTPLCNIGLSICYDLRFPELYRQQMMQGADLLTVPAAFTLTTGKDHWKILLQARAIENQCYVAAPAQWGRHSETRHSFGSALVSDPWGTLVGCAAEGEGMVVSEFDPERLNHVRSIVPIRDHIRHDLFTVSPKSS